MPPDPPRIIQYQPEETDSGFFVRIRAERAQKERYRRARRWAFIITAIPLILLFLNWIAWGAACERIREYEEHKANRPQLKSGGP